MFTLYSYSVFCHRNIKLSHLGTDACVMSIFISGITEKEMLWREKVLMLFLSVYLVVWIIRALKLHIKTKYQDVYNRTKFHAPAYTHSNANINVYSNLETPIYQFLW